MTAKLIKAFPEASGAFQIEPDASSVSYFWAAGFLLACSDPLQAIGVHAEPSPSRVYAPVSAVSIRTSPVSDWQVDAAFPRFLPLPAAISRRADLGDSIMTAIVLAPFSNKPVRFTDLGRLRVQECERVLALRTELTRCGAKVIEEGDTLTVFPSALHGAEIETHGDHRMAMCFAILGLKVGWIRLKNPSCVKKTFPSFYQKLAAPPPAGLGARVLAGRSRRILSEAELFAE
jgi:3-phosphoshikimate 1-carboxyvinyltransferase